MVFGSIKATFTSRRRRQVSDSFYDILSVPYESLRPTTPPSMQGRSLSSVLLPGIRSHKPLTISNFLTIGKTPTEIASAMAEGTAAGSPPNTSSKSNQAGANQSERKITIPRKPVGLPEDPRGSSYVPSFDPEAPRQDPSLHLRARKALLERYSSKFTLPANFIAHGGGGKTIKDYEFLWAKPGELEKKVLEDIIWVRRRFAYARRDEPTDEDLIKWYDAEFFDEGHEADWQESWATLAKQAVHKLAVLKAKEEAKAAEAEVTMDRVSVEVNIGEDIE
ncbi:hypothetical protein V8E51_000339 [Hyaloscypha variabilis]